MLLHRHIPPERLPRWLNEGISQYLSDGLSEVWPHRQQLILKEAIAANREFALAALADRFPAEASDLQLAYEQSRSLVNYMVARFGGHFLPTLLAEMAGGVSAEDALYTVSGLPLAAIERDWRQQQSSPLSWLGLLAGHVYSILFFMAAVATLAGFVRYRRKRRAYDDQEDEE